MKGIEAFPARSLTPLAIQDAGDDLVGIERRQTTQQREGVFICATAAWLGARQGKIDLSEFATAPADCQMGLMRGTVNRYDYFFQQGAQKFFAIAIRSRRPRPDRPGVRLARSD